MYGGEKIQTIQIQGCTNPPRYCFDLNKRDMIIHKD